MITNTNNHLRILMEREMAERVDETPENLIGRALNIAEFIVMHDAPDATEEELVAARKILEMRGLCYLLETSVEEFPRYAAMVRNEVGPKHAFCIKCGRPLKSKNTLKSGMGITCKAQIKEGNWEIDRTNKSTTDNRRREIAENDALPMDNSERLGLRRIALKYGISVSSIRIDRQVNRKKKELAFMADNLIEKGEMPVEADYYPTISEPIVPPPLKPKNEEEEIDPDVAAMKSLNAKAALALVAEAERREDLDTYMRAELKGKNRKTVIKALETRLAEYAEDSAPEMSEEGGETLEESGEEVIDQENENEEILGDEE